MTREFPTVSYTVTQDTINAYAELSGDFNPLHVDAAIAEGSEFGGTIAHGPIAFQALFRALMEGCGADTLPEGTLIDVTYRAPVRPGDCVSSQVTALGEDRYDVACVNSSGIVVIAGQASFIC